MAYRGTWMTENETEWEGQNCRQTWWIRRKFQSIQMYKHMCAVCKHTWPEYDVPVIVPHRTHTQFTSHYNFVVFIFRLFCSHALPSDFVCVIVFAFSSSCFSCSCSFMDLKKRQSKSHINRDGLHVISKGKPTNNVWHTHVQFAIIVIIILIIYKHSRNSNKISLQIIVTLLLMHCCNRHQFVCRKPVESSRVKSSQVHFVYSAVFTRRIFVVVVVSLSVFVIRLHKLN